MADFTTLSLADAQDTTPLFDKEENSDKELEITSQLSSIVSKSTSVAARPFDFLFRRATYYWIAFIAQFCHLVLCTIGFGVVAALETKGKGSTGHNDDDMFIRTAIYSVMCFILLASLLVLHYGKTSKSGPKRFLAGNHHSCAKICTILNAMNCILVALPYVTSKKELLFEDDIRPVIIPLMVGFLFVASGSCFTAGRITYRSAVSARGTESVPDPEYRVPAWTLATTEESQIYRRSSGSIQLPV